MKIRQNTSDVAPVNVIRTSIQENTPEKKRHHFIDSFFPFFYLSLSLSL